MKRFLVPTERSNECKRPAKTQSDEVKITKLQTEHVSGAENGAERAKKLVSGSGAVSGTFEKREARSAEREIGERERSGERKSKKLVERGAAF
jgi:hypothetical protein